MPPATVVFFVKSDAVTESSFTLVSVVFSPVVLPSITLSVLFVPRLMDTVPLAPKSPLLVASTSTPPATANALLLFSVERLTELASPVSSPVRATVLPVRYVPVVLFREL